MFGKISRRRRASVVLPLDEHPLMPTTMAFFSILGVYRGSLRCAGLYMAPYIEYSSSISVCLISTVTCAYRSYRSREKKEGKKGGN